MYKASRPSRVMLHRRGLLMIVALAGLALTGCSSIDVARMVPAANDGPARKIPLTVKVMPASASQEGRFGGPAMIDRETMTKTVVAALTQANVFAGVSQTAGDVELLTTIRSQDQKDLSIAHYTARLLVEYRFIGRDGKTIWAETYDTSSSSTAFSGATRTVTAREGSVRESLASLIQGIKQRWPNP